MERLHFVFTDVVSRKPVYQWTDKLGRPWLATSAWALFRVTPRHGWEIWEQQAKGPRST